MAFEDEQQPQEQENPYRSLIREDQAAQQGAVRTAVSESAQVPPDTRAEAIKLAEQYRLPVDVVERNLDAFKQQRQADEPEARQLLRHNPKLAEWLTSSPAAAAARDDLGKMQELDNRLTFGASILRGVDNVQAMWGRFLQWSGETLPEGTGGPGVASGLRTYGRRVAEVNEQQARDLGYKSTAGDAFDSPAAFAQYVKETIGEQIPIMAPIMAGGAAGAKVGAVLGSVEPGPGNLAGATIGGIIGAAAVGLPLAIGETEGQLKQIDPEATAPGLVFLGGSAIAALDAIVPGKIGTRLVKTFGFETAERAVARALLQPVKPTFLRGVVGQGVQEMASEGLTEALQEAIGDLTAAAGTGTAMDWRATGQHMLEAGVAGALVGGTFSMTADAARLHRERAHYAAAQQQEQFFTALGQTVTDSKLHQRLPQGMREFVAKWTKDGPLENVYAPTDTWNEYWQKQGVSPAVMAAELTGRSDALEHATKTGTDLAIPLAAYAQKLAATEHNAFFAQELKLDPKLLNLRQTKELAESFRQVQTGAVGERAPMDENVARGAAEVGQRIYDQAIASGELPAVAEKWQELYATAYGNIAQRYKRDPVQLFEARPLAIMRDDGAVFTPAAKGERVGIDIPRSEATPHETAAQRRSRRQAHMEALVSSYVRDARRLDPSVDPAMIRAEVEQRIEMAAEATRATRESGAGVDLLTAIAQYGGIRDTGSHPGEFRHYAVEGQDKRRRGDRGPRTWNGVKGVFDLEGTSARSLGFDDMVRTLMQDQRFQHLGDDLNNLIDAIDSAMRAKEEVDAFPGTEELQDLGIVPGTTWWKDSWLVTPTSVPATPEGVVAEEDVLGDQALELDEGGDDSFNVDEFEQRRVTPEQEARAIALYHERGGGRSPVRMAAALRDVGAKLPARTAAEKRASNEYVQILLERAEPALTDDQEQSYRSWAANASKVAADPPSATISELQRASGYLSHKLVALRRQAEKAGRELAPETAASLTNEIDWYTRLIVEKRDGELLQVGTPAFRAWFGNSQVVDAQGRPLVVYHGTGRGGFEAFESADGVFYFTDNQDTAYSYAGRRKVLARGEARPGLVAAYLRLTNPLVVDFEGNHYDGYLAGATDQSDEDNWTDLTLEGAIRDAKANGHDGVIARDIIAQGPEGDRDAGGEVSTVYVAFAPTQIKSATDNRGTFDPTDPNQFFQEQTPSAAEARLAELPDTEITLPTGKVAGKRVPFQVLTDITTQEALYRASWGRAGVVVPDPQPIALKDVVATQTWLFPDVVREYLANPEKPVAQAIFWQGRYYLTDGHHRATAEQLKGALTVLARVVDADEQLLERELPQPPSGTAGPPVLSQQPIPTAGINGVGVQPSGDTDAQARETLEAGQRIEEARAAAKAEVDRELGITPTIGRGTPAGEGELFQLDPEDEPEGFAILRPGMSEDEAQRVRAETAETMVAFFETLPADVDWRDVAIAGQAKKGWYATGTKVIQAVFGPVDAPRFTALLAAMSPRVQVQENLTNALRMWIAWDEAGRPTAPAQIRRLLERSRGKNVAGVKRKVLNSWINNVVRVLRTPDGGRYKLSGAKVESFMQNLLGNLEEVTNDAWMAGWALLDQKVFAGNELRDVESGELLEGKAPAYVAFNIKTRLVAKQLTTQTGERWTPANVQETIWSWQKTLYELAKARDESAVRLVREGAISDAAIAETPDFARLMTRDATIREMLEAAGYGKVLSAIEKVVAADARRRDAASRRAGAGPGEASQRVTPGILRSARRIDELRRRRKAASDAERAATLKATKRKMREAAAAARARREELTQPGRRRGSTSRARPTLDEAIALNEQLEQHLQQIQAELSLEVAGVKFEAYLAAGGDIFVDYLEVPETARGEGFGTRAMRRLFEFADRHNLAVSLFQAPAKGKKEALARFYRRLGFIHNGSARYYDAALGGPWVRPSKTERGDELYQETTEPLAEDFYSRIFRTVEASTMPRASGKQWKNTIRNSKLGINLDEFHALAVDKLEDDQVYTQEQLLEHLAQHELAVEVHVLDDEQPGPTDDEVDTLADELYEAEIDKRVDAALEDGRGVDVYVEITDESDELDRGDGVETWNVAMRDSSGHIIEDQMVDSEQEAEDLRAAWEEKAEGAREEDIRDIITQQVDYQDFVDEARRKLGADYEGSDEARETQYRQYVEPGGDEDSYREVFLTAPNARADVKGAQRQHVDDAIQMALRESEAAGTENERRNQQIALGIWRKLRELDDYRSMYNAEYRRQFFRALTYAENTALHDIDTWRMATVASSKATTWEDGHDDYHFIRNPIVRLRFNTRTAVDGTTTMFLEEVQAPGPENQKLMPPLFRKHWRELAMKWALHHAVVSGFDRIAWTSGAMQVKRYNLAQHVTAVSYYPETKMLAAYDKEGNEAIRERPVEREDLARYIGDELAQRLLAGAPQVNHRYRLRNAGGGRLWEIVDETADDVIVFSSNEERDARDQLTALTAQIRHRYTLEGETALTVGGEGLTTLYDKDLPAILNKLVKKAGGAKVAVQPVPFGQNRLTMPMPAGWTERYMREAGLGPALNVNDPRVSEALDRAKRAWEAQHPPLDDTRQVPALTLTPAVKDQVLKGLALYQPDQGGRDIQGAFNPNTNVVRLLSGKADLTTFLHESGHFFLELLADIAVTVDPATEDANEQQLLRDMAAVLKYGNYQGTLTEWRALPVDARRSVHEAFARAFEQYLSDGRAPSAQLRQLFMRFRDWIVAAYRNARGLNIEIPDDIRGVFDRLLASDDAIADAQEATNLQPLFSDAASAGIDPLTFEAYRQKMAAANVAMREELDRKLLRDWKRERQAWWQAEREVVAHAVRDEVHADPLYIALSVMRTGKLPNGDMPTMGDGRPIKLSKRILIREFPRELVDALSKKRPPVYAVEGGIHPDTAAELFGFASGQALLEGVVSAAPMQRVIEDETNRRMRQAHGDQLLDGMQLRELAEGVVQDHRAEIISEELRVLTEGMTGSVIPPAQVIKAEAQAYIRRTPYRELRPGRYLQAARTASRQAFEAFGRNDRRGAIEAKRTELVAMAHWRAARDAKERADTIRTTLQEFASKNSIRARLAKAGGAFLEQIDGFLDRYEFARVAQKQLDRRASLRKFLEQLQADGLPIDGIPPDVVDDSRRVNWQELPLEELEGVYQAVQQIKHLATLKNKLLKAKDARELAEVRAEMAASIREHVTERSKTHEPRSTSERRKAFFEGIFASHRKIASLARELDGFQDGGPMWSYVIRPLNEAANREATMNADATARLGAIFSKHYTASERGAFGKLQWIPALGDRTNRLAALSREARLMVALNWGNETNRKRLLAGKGWSQAQAEAVLETLDKRDWQFVQDVWDFIDGYWPEIAAKQTRVRGLPPPKEEPIPVFTRFGEFRGGYFPLVPENELSGKFDKLKNAGAAMQQQAAAYARAVPSHGYVEERAEGNVVYPVRLDFGVIFSHTTQVIHDLTHHEVLIDIGRLVGSDEVDLAIRETLGPRAVDQFTRALHDIAVGDAPAQHELETAIGYLRTGSTVTGLAWSVSTMFLQPLGLTQSMSRIGTKWVLRGMAKWVRGAAHMESVVAGIQEKSEFMRNRARTVMREVNELRNQVVVGHGGRVQQAISDSFFTGIAKFQLVADVPTWLGAYEKALSEGREESEAIALADQAVLDAQGGGQIKDLAAVQRGGPAWKLWTNFYSFFNTTYNLWTESYRRAKHTKDPIEIGRLAVDYLLLFAVPAVLGHLVRAGLAGGLDDELEKPDEFAMTLAGELGAYMFGTMIGLREISGTLQGFSDYSGPAGARGFATFANLATQAGQMKADEAFFRALNATAGVLFHYPAAQVDRTVRGILALVNGETSNPLAPLVGPPPKRRR